MKKLDRKQMQQVIVLGVLFLAAIGYAAYQLFFTGSTGASTKSSATTTSTSRSAEGEQEQQTTEPPWLSSTGPARDPFVVPPQFDNLKQSRSQSVRTASARIPPAPNISALPPMPVMPVSGNNTPPGGNSAPSGYQTASASQPEPEPGIVVTGVVVGERPVAIVRAEGGSQRIAQPGNQLEGGYILREVSRDGIVLEKDGKTVTLRPGGNPNAK